jgi:para-nitrobenzyl esterase
MAVLLGSLPARARDSLTVRTEAGLLHGVDQGTQRAYLGIPFAAPPVGKLRWRPPEPPQPWSGVRDASQFGPRCPQVSWDDQGNPFDDGNEDCLNLNVWVPAGATATSALPVMAWYFPGGNEAGDNRADLSAFVSRGVIVVAANYRLGKLGWFAHPLLVAENGRTSPNYGLADQTQSLRWIARNIAAFGGDPQNVTIFGSSAGGVDVDVQLTDPDAQGLFQKAIVSIGSQTAQRLQDMEFADAQLAQAAGCGPTVPDVLGCLRALSFDALNAGLSDEENTLRYNNTNFGLGANPVVDGMTFVEEPMFYLRAHRSVPLLIGYNVDDYSAFMPLPCSVVPAGWYCQDYGTTQQVLDRNLGDGIAPWLPWNQPFAAALDQYYSLPGQIEPRPLAPPFSTIFAALARQQTDQYGGMSLRYQAHAAADGGAPVYSYAFTHALENPDYPFYAVFQTLGATHMMQEAFYSVFKMAIDPSYVPTPAELQLANRMADIWTNFAKTGNPNGPGIPAWPRYDSSEERVMILDDNMGVQSHFRSGEDDLALAQYLFDPWTPLFPFAENGPCTGLYYCKNFQNEYRRFTRGVVPDNPYSPDWQIFQYPPTQMMLDAVGQNGWSSP